MLNIEITENGVWFGLHRFLSHEQVMSLSGKDLLNIIIEEKEDKEGGE